MMSRGQHVTIDGASIILAELCGVLLGLRRSEHFASAEANPNPTTLLCFKNLVGISWNLGDGSEHGNLNHWSRRLTANDIIRVRLCYTKHQRHRVAHEVVAGPGFRQMSFALWLRVVVRIRLGLKEKLSVDSPLLMRLNKGKLVPMTGAFMARMDQEYAPVLGWRKATIHSRRRGFVTAAVRCGIHMASIALAMRHSQGVTLQYVTLPLSEKASFTTRLAIAAYEKAADTTNMEKL